PYHSKMSSDAHKRIDAIMAASSLGAGFTLASHDLEIRGAGEFLGDEQSGHLQKIGFSLYLEMLEETVKAMKSGKAPSFDLAMENTIEINLRIPALIPEEYLPDVHTRLVMYKTISGADSFEDLEQLQVEMIDRFGLLPDQLKLLFRLTGLKLQALKFGIRKIDANIQSGRVEFAAKTRVDPLSIVELVQESPQHYKLTSANQLTFYHHCGSDATGKLDFISDMLTRFRITDQPSA
ncbi:MAG: transcription-repair coupling factor, partial [Gammaproteobacteria bacterium]|nr:transcription-repair coupling factor [Gammaproteobacteria bacterium]